MKPTMFACTILGFGLVVAGCETRSSTTGESQSSVGPAPAAATQQPLPSTAVAQGSKAVWPERPGAEPPSGAAEEKPQPAPKDPEPGVSTRKEPRVEVEEEPKPEKDPPIPETFKALNKEKTLFFEKTKDDKRRVHILAEVCLREGPLEVFLCKANTKEHESILHVDLDARDIHTALLAAGAKRGTTVRFVPKYVPATGDTIRVTVTYHKDGKLLTKPAQYWIQDIRTKKDMPHDWVFAGSRDFKFPDDPDRPPYYCANNGEVISISNFSDSMLDLPVMSSKEAAELGYVANKERIPPLKTKVIVTMEVLKKG